MARLGFAGRMVRLRIGKSKNKEARILPLTGRRYQLIEQRENEHRLDCPYVFISEKNGSKNFAKPGKRLAWR
jgi:integrase